ncbi:hypothetical protein ILUMI_02910, partial [Ignelater luminosus]
MWLFRTILWLVVISISNQQISDQVTTLLSNYEEMLGRTGRLFSYNYDSNT